MSRDMLSWGLGIGTEQMATHAGSPVRYARGPDSVVVRATLGPKRLSLADEFGTIRIVHTDMSMLVPVADLVLAGERITPRRGDQVFVDGDYGTKVFEVFPYGTEDTHRLVNADTAFYIHLKFVDVEPYS